MMDDFQRRQQQFEQELARQRLEQERRRKQQLITAGGALAGALLSYAVSRYLNREEGQAKAQKLIDEVTDDIAAQAKREIGNMFSQALGGEPQVGQPPPPPPVFRTPDGNTVRDADFEILD